MCACIYGWQVMKLACLILFCSGLNCLDVMAGSLLFLCHSPSLSRPFIRLPCCGTVLALDTTGPVESACTLGLHQLLPVARLLACNAAASPCLALIAAAGAAAWRILMNFTVSVASCSISCPIDRHAVTARDAPHLSPSIVTYDIM